jgi:DNA topoisomerase-1
MKLYTEGTDDENDEDGPINLPNLTKGEIAHAKTIHGLQVFSKPPSRYTEAALVKKLESEGIGRPSTYAPTITTVIDRGYIEREEKKLKPTDIAFVVNDFLEKHFKEMMDYKFTANVENEFDEVAT